MTHVLSHISRYLQTAFACLVCVMAINMGAALAQEEVPAQISSAGSDMAGQAVLIVEAAYQPASIARQGPDMNPVVLMADPGMAYVFSTPSRQMQLSVEGAAGNCFTQITQTDTTGVIAVPMAQTRRCEAPRLVIIH